MITQTYASISDKATEGCQRCIRSGFNFCTKSPWFNHAAAYDADDYCCEDTSSDCNGGAVISGGAIQAGFRCSKTDFTSVDYAIAACPTKTSVCGATKLFEAKDKSVAA